MRASIEELIGKLETCHDPALVATARDLAQSIMDLHGAALERMLEIVSRAGAAGEGILEEFARDERASAILALYGLHPLDLETRVRRAVEKLRARHGGVELLSLRDGVLTIGLTSHAPGLRGAVEDAITGAAPDLSRVVFEEFGFVPVAQLRGVGV
jgi:hypothetical protein